MMYFQEWTSFKPISYIMSPLGVALVLIGIALLQPSQDASAEALAEYEPMNDATGAEGEGRGIRVRPSADWQSWAGA